MKEERAEEIEMENVPLEAPKKAERSSRKENIAILNDIKKHSIGNEIEIVTSKECGCFFCRSTFSARDVQDWIDDENGVTAICPECGMDAVVGDASGYTITRELMKEMNQTFYGSADNNVSRQAAEVYVSRYLSGKIAHKEKSEALYINYLKILEEKGDSLASLALGSIYQFGTEFTLKDIDEALLHYTKPALFDQPDALNAIGDIHLSRMNDPEDTKIAYECFAKATALGNLSSVYRLVDCYSHGLYVHKDEKFAFSLLKNSFAESFMRFGSPKDSWYDFPEFSYRMAVCYENGLGTSIDDELALKYYLITEFACNMRLAFYGFEHNPKLLKKAIDGIEALGKKHSLRRGAPVYDIDTFEDSFEEQFSQSGDYEFGELSYDEDEHELSVTISYPNLTLITDIGNLNSSFISGSVLWKFKDVASFRAGESTTFNKVEGDYDSGYRFILETSDGEAPVLEINFMPDQNGRFGLKVKEKK